MTPLRASCTIEPASAVRPETQAPCPIWLNFAIKRDLRRAALFGWMTPLPATRSSMLIASPTAVAAAVASPARMAISAFLTKVRAAERYGRLRKRRRSLTRMRFSADLLLANVNFPSIVTSGPMGTPQYGSYAAMPGWYQKARSRAMMTHGGSGGCR